MKARFLIFCAVLFCGAGAMMADSDVRFQQGRVLELDQKVLKGLVLEVEMATSVYANKKGGQRLGVFPSETRVQLVAMTERAYKVRGKAKHGMVSGWVNPKHLISNDTDFQKNLAAYYQRWWAIKELVAAKEVAIGMTKSEVKRSLGEPTKRKDTISKQGRSGSWEYIQSEERKHYVYRKDHLTGQVYRQYSHSTVEVTEQLSLEFEDGVVTSITRLKDDSKSDVRIIVPPVLFTFQL